MTKDVRYHHLFVSDLEQAADWYDERSPGLGEALIDRVADAARRVIRSPEEHGVGPLGLRVCRVSRFPYVIPFEQVGKTILILGLFHSAMSEERWRERSNRRT